MAHAVGALGVRPISNTASDSSCNRSYRRTGSLLIQLDDACVGWPTPISSSAQNHAHAHFAADLAFLILKDSPLTGCNSVPTVATTRAVLVRAFWLRIQWPGLVFSDVDFAHLQPVAFGWGPLRDFTTTKPFNPPECSRPIQRLDFQSRRGEYSCCIFHRSGGRSSSEPVERDFHRYRFGMHKVSRSGCADHSIARSFDRIQRKSIRPKRKLSTFAVPNAMRWGIGM